MYVCVCVCPCVCVSALFSTQLNNFLLMRLRGARCAKVFMINFSHTHALTHRYSTGIATKLASKTHTHTNTNSNTHTRTHSSVSIHRSLNGTSILLNFWHFCHIFFTSFCVSLCMCDLGGYSNTNANFKRECNKISLPNTHLYTHTRKSARQRQN